MIQPVQITWTDYSPTSASAEITLTCLIGGPHHQDETVHRTSFTVGIRAGLQEGEWVAVLDLDDQLVHLFQMVSMEDAKTHALSLLALTKIAEWFSQLLTAAKQIHKPAYH
jgi:hypothetical protein